jgi:soluble lytic murein transglycosylase
MAFDALSRAVAGLLAIGCLSAAVGTACTHKAHQGGGAVSASARSAAASVPAAPGPDGSPDATAPNDERSADGTWALSWVDAVRLGHWERALQQLDGLDPKQRERAEIRYVHARVALALGRNVAAVQDLGGLEVVLPLLARDIALYRAEAQIQAGPSEDAARLLASQTDATALMHAAIAWEKAGRAKEAREAIDRAIAASQRGSDDVAVEAHAIRARIAEAAGDRVLAASDLRFVATRGPGRDEAGDIGEAIARLDPRRALSSSERVDRARRMAHDGDSQAAIQELDRAAHNSAAPLSQAELVFAKAMSLYLDRGHYAQAAEAFEQAAGLDSAMGAEATYRAAKAWARAEMNARAQAGYEQVKRRYPTSRWAERAAYQIARLGMLEAKWGQAALGYASYRARYPRGEDIQAARYEHAVSLLLAGQHAKARKALGALAGKDPDRLSAGALRHLQSIAAQLAGDTQSAMEGWSSLVREQPLSWPALVAGARLRAAGQPAALPIVPASGASLQPLNISLPEPARMLASLGLEHDAEQYLREHETHLAAEFGNRSGEATCLLYSSLGRAHRRYQVALHAVPGALLHSAPSSSSRWAWECSLPQAYPSVVRMLEQRESLPPGLIHAVMRQESGFNPEARSPAGAVGLMQLLPSTARKIADEFGVPYVPEQLFSPWFNLDLAARYLKKLLSSFGGEVPLAVAAYNAGPKAVAHWLQACGDLPLDLWVARIPYAETRGYVQRVMGNYARYSYLRGAEQAVTLVKLELPKGIELGADAY